MAKQHDAAVRIVVSGSSGCIGSSLVPILRECGCEVCTIPSDYSTDMFCDGKVFDVFVNLAWKGSRGVQRSNYALQLDMAKTALNYYELACRLGCRRFICPGTIGELMAELPECQNMHSQSAVYVNVKSSLHRLLRSVESDSCAVVWARLGNLYGKDDAGNLVGWTLSRILAGEVAEFGPAKQPYEFVSMEDCVHALAALAMAPSLSSNCYYVGCGKPRELGELLREIGRLAGRENLIAIGSRPDDGTRYCKKWFDISRLTADTGFHPEISFAEGVGKLIEYMRGRAGNG